MQRIDEKREASGQNAMLEQVRTWQQEQDTEPDKYAVFDTMSADWGGEEDGFVLYEIPEEYSRTGGYFPEKMQVYTYCVCKQYGVRYITRSRMQSTVRQKRNSVNRQRRRR